MSPGSTASWGRTYEGWVSRAAGLPEDGWRRRSWVEAYRRVSDLIQRREGEGRSTGSLAGDEEGAWIRALVFGQRAFLCARRLGVGGQASIIDVGSGTGGAGLAALENGSEEVLAYEMSDLDARIGEAIHRARGGGAWRRARSLKGTGAGDWLWSFSWGEMAEGEEALARWLRRGGGGQWWIIEPGTKRSAQALARTRDRFAVHVRAPCPATAQCPRREGRDWCHFTWNLGFGPMASWILEACGRESRRILCSFLRLSHAEERVAGGGSRLLQVQKGKEERLDFCGPDGPWRAEVSRKRRGAVQGLSGQKDGYDWVERQGPWRQDKPGLWRPDPGGHLVSRGTL